MVRTFLTSLVLVITFLVVACNDDPRGMSYGRFRHLSSEERMKVGEKLSEKELQNIVTVAVSNQYDSAALDMKKLDELIVEGEKIRMKIEPVSPTK